MVELGEIAQELAELIALYLEERDLFRAFRINKLFWSFSHAEVFWQKLFKQHRLAPPIGANTSAADYYRIYKRRVCTTKVIKAKQAPSCKSHNIWTESTRDDFAISDEHWKGEANVTLFFRYDEVNGMDIYVSGALRHESKPLFKPMDIFESGRLCMGWEQVKNRKRRRLVIRDVDKWSIVGQLKTDNREWVRRSDNCDGLLCIHHENKDAGTVEMWDSRVKRKDGKIHHIGLSDYLWSETTNQLVTASKDGLIKVWNGRSCTFERLFQIEEYEMLLEVQQGILSIATVDDGPKTFRNLDGGPLPERLVERLSNHHGWITFSDGVHVVDAQDDYQFEVLAADGTELARFSHISGHLKFPFLDEFIITASRSHPAIPSEVGSLKIWSKSGEELSSQRLDSKHFYIVPDEQAQLIIFTMVEHSTARELRLDKVIVYDFANFDAAIPRAEEALRGAETVYLQVWHRTAGRCHHQFCLRCELGTDVI